jgi:hypothetical protein
MNIWREKVPWGEHLEGESSLECWEALPSKSFDQLVADELRISVTVVTSTSPPLII